MPFSPSRIVESNTPHTGFIKPKIATFETGLCFKSTAHSEYAAADTKARYKSMRKAFALM